MAKKDDNFTFGEKPKIPAPGEYPGRLMSVSKKQKGRYKFRQWEFEITDDDGHTHLVKGFTCTDPNQTKNIAEQAKFHSWIDTLCSSAYEAGEIWAEFPSSITTIMNWRRS